MGERSGCEGAAVSSPGVGEEGEGTESRAMGAEAVQSQGIVQESCPVGGSLRRVCLCVEGGLQAQDKR